jgi:hypothetical protein
MLLRMPNAFSLLHLGADLVGIDQFSALGGSTPLINFDAVLGEPCIPVMEQFQRPLDNLLGFW